MYKKPFGYTNFIVFFWDDILQRQNACDKDCRAGWVK